MNAEQIDLTLCDAIRQVVADIVEVDAGRIEWKTHFWTGLGADSLQALEILSGLERRFDITIEQSSLPLMQDLESVYAVVVAALQVAKSPAE